MSEFWINNPGILFDNLCNFNPFSEGSVNEQLNNSTRFIIYVCAILAFINNNLHYLYVGGTLIILIVIYYAFICGSSNNNNNNDKKEKFNGNNLIINNLDKNSNNPLKNIEIPQYGTKEKTKESPPSFLPYNNDITKDIKGKMFQDPFDYLFDKGTRQYYTMPNTSVPNKQTEFANWLYGSETNCKAGSIYAHRPGQPREQALCNGFNVSVPTNFGKL